jgi:hypothetical protein
MESRKQIMSGKTPGQAAYEGYRAFSRGKSLISGQPIPEWDVLEDDLTAAWEAAAAASAHARTAELLGELNTVTAERDDARAAFADLAGHFGKGAQSGWTARISGTVLHRLCLQACVPDPDGQPAPAIVTAGTHHIAAQMIADAEATS